MNALCRLANLSPVQRRLLGLTVVGLLFAGLLLIDTNHAAAQTVDWTTLTRAGGGVGWNDNAGAGPQSFVNVGGTGIGMTVSYSPNMRDGTPGIYGVNAPVPPLQASLRWTGNPNNAGGAPGAADGAAFIALDFTDPIVINSFTVGSLSLLTGPTRYEWIEVRAYDEENNLIVTDRLTASTHVPPAGAVTVRPGSPAISEPGPGIYQGRGTSLQGSCTDVCGYDRFTLAYVTTPVKRIELAHFATAGASADSGFVTNGTSVAIESFSVEAPTYDYGDLPAGEGLSYGTTSAQNGPSHLVRTTLYMGALVDAEADGQPSVAANGDDLNPAGGPDDEDGIDPADLQLAEEQVAVIPVQVTNTTGRSATLYGWIDFDGSGAFDLFEGAQVNVPDGSNNSTVFLDFGTVPVNDVTATYARFRLSGDGAAASPGRPAFDGEVEDYPVTIALKPVFDWGDAPDSYGTTAGDGGFGANHRIIPELFIGTLIDDEADGQPTPAADGDDVNPAGGPDDEDGVLVEDLQIAEGGPATVRVRVTNRLATAATLYGWIDFDGNGAFDFGERTQVPVSPGAENAEVVLNFGVTPVNGVTATYARIRLSTDVNASSPTRSVGDGEVEDYRVTIELAPEFDWGDAPDSYATDENDGGEGVGPHHVIAPAVFLGARLDEEDDGQPTQAADGDDLQPPGGPDDEDGVRVADLSAVATLPLRLRVVVNNETANPARLYGWVDFNRNGRFEQFERAQLDVAAGTRGAEVILDFGDAPDTGVSASVESYARFRISTDTTAAAMPTGPAGDGEVEDYVITLLPRPLVEDPRPDFTTLYAAGEPKTIVRTAGGAEPPASLPQSPDDRTPDLTDSFEAPAIDPARFTVTDEAGTAVEIVWGVDGGQARRGSNSLWIGAGGADGRPSGSGQTPPNLNTWLTLANPLDLTNVKAADIEFWLSLDSEPAADTIFVGVSTDGVTYDGKAWSGDSGGWTYFKMDLADYLGYPQVYVAWVFTSGSDDVAIASGVISTQDTVYEGVWLDDVAVWTYQTTDPVRETQTLQNGGFEDGLADWQVIGDSTVTVIQAASPVPGTNVAVMGGTPNAQDIIYQGVSFDDVEAAAASLILWVNVFGEETALDQDEFCVRLYRQGGGGIDLNNLLVDLGCLDGAQAAFQEANAADWRRVEFDLPAELWDDVRGETVYLLLDMHTNGELNSTAYVDGIQVQVATDGTPGDRFEPNDFARIATPVGFDGGPPLGEFITNLTIDPRLDVDVYGVRANPGDRIRVDVDAKADGSLLDARVAVFGPDRALLCAADNDGATSDPYAVCTATAAGEHVVEVTSFDNRSGRDHTYALNLQVIPPGAPVPEPERPEAPAPPSGPAAWTAIIYLVGDNNLCRDYENPEFSIIRNLETQLGSKIDVGGFLNVVVLFDRNQVDGGCGDDGTVRYHIQPNGNYTIGLNLWPQDRDLNMGDKNTLVDFVTRAMRQFPADHYYVAIEDHGNAVQGIAEDWSSMKNGKRDRLETRELYSAFKDITDAVGRKFDVLGYEACLMGAYEATYDVREFTDYVFFFPTISYTNRASYPAYLKHPDFTAATDGRQFGNIMFDVYRENVFSNPYVMTLVNTAGAEALQNAVDDWSEALIRSLNEQADSPERLTQARSRAQKIDSQSSRRGDGSASDGVRLSDEDYYLDLYDLAAQVAAEGIAVAESQAVMNAVQATVEQTFARSGGSLQYRNTHGLTIFWPKTCGGEYRRYVRDEVFTSTIDGSWDEFLGAYFATVSDKKDESACLAAEYSNLIDRQQATQEAPIYLPLIRQEAQ